MRDYRLYFLDEEGHIKQARDIEASSEHDAIGIAVSLFDGRRMELWQREKRLRTWSGSDAR